MATTREYIAFVCEQIERYGAVKSRKMFGEYMAYLNGKQILMVCDNTVFVKKLPQVEPIMKAYENRLLDHSLAQAAALGFGAVCFEGDIGFYGKSGFVVAATKGIRYHGLPDGADASFFLCKELTPGYLDGVRGEYATPQEYFVCEQDPKGFAAYEAQFPAKEKLRLPGQLFEA